MCVNLLCSARNCRLIHFLQAINDEKKKKSARGPTLGSNSLRRTIWEGKSSNSLKQGLHSSRVFESHTTWVSLAGLGKSTSRYEELVDNNELLLEIDLIIRALSRPGRPAAATKTTTTTTTTTTGQRLSQEYSSGAQPPGNKHSKWDVVVFSYFHGLRPQDLGDIFFSSRL